MKVSFVFIEVKWYTVLTLNYQMEFSVVGQSSQTKTSGSLWSFTHSLWYVDISAHTHESRDEVRSQSISLLNHVPHYRKMSLRLS